MHMPNKKRDQNLTTSIIDNKKDSQPVLLDRISIIRVFQTKRATLELGARINKRCHQISTLVVVKARVDNRTHTLRL